MVNNDVVVFVDVGAPINPDGVVGISFWSYGHRATSFAYKKDGPPFDRFMISCASTYVTAELGWWKMKLVSGPNLIGPRKYILVFRRVDDGDEFGGTSEATSQHSGG